MLLTYIFLQVLCRPLVSWCQVKMMAAWRFMIPALVFLMVPGILPPVSLILGLITGSSGRYGIFNIGLFWLLKRFQWLMSIYYALFNIYLLKKHKSICGDSSNLRKTSRLVNWLFPVFLQTNIFITFTVEKKKCKSFFFRLNISLYTSNFMLGCKWWWFDWRHDSKILCSPVWRWSCQRVSLVPESWYS